MRRILVTGILEHIRDVEPLLRATCTHEIDTSAPLVEVVERLIEIAEIVSGRARPLDSGRGAAA